MAFSIAALVADGTTKILDSKCVDVSYPTFYDTFEQLLNRIRIHITSKKLFNFLIFNGKNHVFAILELNNISFLIEKGGYNL